MTFDLISKSILENDRVLLRPLEAMDAEYLMDISLHEPETWEFSLIKADGLTNLEKYIQLALKAKETQKEFPYVVFDKLSGKYAGSTRFYDINFEFKSLQLGYTWYGKDFRGTGLNKHCKYLLLCFAFESLGMERVEFRADANNQRSIAAMKRIGCTVEGVLRSHMPTSTPEIRRDSIVLSILKDEWFGNVKTNLEKQL